ARGDFRLVLSRYAESEAAGVSTGRFAGLIGTTTVGSLIGAPQSAGVIRAQVRFEPDSPRHLNVCQVPDVLPYQLPIGVHADRGRPGVIDWREIDIVADEDRLRLVWHRTGEEVVPVRPHMLGIHTAPPVARFLFEVAAAGAAAWSPWRWGWSEVLPFLPRVRHGRVIVRPARWRPTARLLEAAAVADGAWPAEVERWRERWDVPRFVQIASEDETCPLDLENALHLRMFRQELTSRDVDICEDLTASPSSFGWLSGHANEVIVSLVRREPAPEARRPRVLAHASRASAPHPPGGEWLYAKIYAAAEDHSQILTGRLARLADNIAGLTDRCFYTRYRDPDPHLRFRVHGDPEVLLGSVLPALRECVEQLHAERLVRHFSLDTYTPEEHRYGGRAAMSHAEEVFALDSRSAVRLMRLSASGALPLPGPVLAAVHYGVLLDALGDWPWWEWVDAAFPNVEAHRRYYRAHRVLARAWITPGRCLETLVRGTGADDLERLWNASPAPRAYGALVLGNSADARTATAVDGLLHMQHNRL
ncbi:MULTISPECIES: lantibiotic dehydratase, partial [unclassified Streptomyces]|uniref:lantibiotic dehydratase n=1 Tax=unclassified Streptomyces TaxID=2593676 RepID=UPI00081F3CDC